MRKYKELTLPRPLSAQQVNTCALTPFRFQLVQREEMSLWTCQTLAEFWLTQNEPSNCNSSTTESSWEWKSKINVEIKKTLKQEDPSEALVQPKALRPAVFSKVLLIDIDIVKDKDKWQKTKTKSRLLPAFFSKVPSSNLIDINIGKDKRQRQMTKDKK